MKHPLLVMMRKELSRIFTDKRLIFSTFLLPAISTFLLYAAVGSFTKSFNDKLKAYEPTIGIVAVSMDFKTFLDQEQKASGGSKIHWMHLDSETTARSLIISGTLDAAIIMDKTDSNQAPTVKLLFNPDKEFSSEANRVFRKHLDAYRTLKLEELLGSKETADIFKFIPNDPESRVTTPGGSKDTLMSRMIPMMLSILLFSGCLGIGIDSVAGEKERGTLATLLMTPIPREIIAFGKIISLCILSILCAIFSGLGLLAALPFIKNLEGSSNSASLTSMTSFNGPQIATLLGLLILLAAAYASLVCFISIISKSVKEASTYAAPIYLGVTLTSYQALFTVGSEPEGLDSILPIYSMIMTLRSFFSGTLTGNQALLACLSTVAFILLLVIIIKELFNNERILLRQ